MAQVEQLVVSSFKGIRRPGVTDRLSVRQVLDEPREMFNFHLTDMGHLYMPAAATVLYDFSADGVIKTIHYAESPHGMVVQLSNGKIYFMPLVSTNPPIDHPDPVTATLLATIPAGEEEWNIWVNNTRQDYFLMGYAPRGSAGPATDGKTWKVEAGPTVTDLSSTVEDASYSTLFKGRRFWVKRGRQVYYSPLNQYDQPETVDTTFTISGDDAGNTYIDNPGNAQGMVSWEDVLLFFLSGSVWILTGGSPDTWNLRQAQTIVGNNNSWTLVKTDQGVLSLGGHNINERGVYLFTGSNSPKVSGHVDDLMRDLGTTYATYNEGKYILATSRTGANDRQFLIMDTQTNEWVAFDGFENGVASIRTTTLYVSKDGVLYAVNRQIFPRYPGRGASITVGYHDDENPSGLSRYLAVKLTGRMWGTGTMTVTVTATTSDSIKVSGPHNVPTDVFDNLVIPLNIRGSAIELQIDFTAADDDNELLIENLQVITSRKGEKVSRG